MTPAAETSDPLDGLQQWTPVPRSPMPCMQPWPCGDWLQAKDVAVRIDGMRKENAENVLILRCELGVYMEALSELPDEALERIPVGKLVLALKASESDEKRRAVRCYIDDVMKQNAELRAEVSLLLRAANMRKETDE